MVLVPSSEPAVAPILTAGLLLVAITLLAALGLPHPTAMEVLAKTGTSRSPAYVMRARILALLPTLLRPPGRPPVPPPPRVDTGALSREILAFLMGHPGAAVATPARHRYSDAFRHQVVDLARQHPDLGIAALAEAVGVPAPTVQDWLAAPAGPVAPSAPPEPAETDESTNARIASILDAWSRWDGGLASFCRFVRTGLAIHYGRTLIRHILEVHAGRRFKRRKGRSPDERATRDALVSFFPGAQWFEDGSQIRMTVNDHVYTFNWEICVDGYSCAIVGASVRKEEDSVAVIEAFEDGVATTGAKSIALTTDNKAPNHTAEVAAALGDTIHVRTTLGRPQNDAPVEGAFGLFRQQAPPLIICGDTEEELARAFLALFLTIWCRATNHRPRSDRDGRSRVQLYQGEQPTDEQIALAKTQLEERRRLQDLAYLTRKARLDPVVRALLDDAFARLGFDDPTGNVKDAIARYPHDAVIAGIATFEGKRDAGTLPPNVGPRYLLGIVRHITEYHEGHAIADHLWRLRLHAHDGALLPLEDARNATVGTPAERIRCFVDLALASDGPLVRSYWLAAVADVILDQPADQRRLFFDSAARRIHATFRLDTLERQAAVRTIAERILPVA